ncbi:Ldh family oxidoreductase [Prosthecomicrobium pneumaticum]|uniref:LDH2 family malate/lactate/ureidoglycolate dehydrogenase n=1 Tax=Prosthecomicrobium pneumaticum TaxID=81895 RepID=A0A7W9CUL8_9HYPH|nr:Ldh family oxidoreductase [Prosthecomicrobium pneumaticum]MBB5752220.1 LDH2 family malate/lactate/ureidoglycolate dehydrogenase [Prosthecomicrobium pneumaticum]
MAIEQLNGVRTAKAALEEYVEALLGAAGADAPSAAAVARSVVDASSRGVDTHGVRLVPWYLQMIEGGRINGRPVLGFEKKAAAVGHVDADNGFGHLASYRAIEEGIALAKEAGVAAITVGRSSHHGASGVYALAAARQGFAAISMTHADPAVVPFGGKKPFFGTNPLAFAVPAPGEEPMLLDMATSAIPYNRIFLRRATGTPLPAEVAVDAEGHPTRDPHAATAVRPLGGADFGYKGAGLASMVDILCSAFTGMGHGATIDPLAGSDYSKTIPIGHFFLVMNPSIFQAFAAFDARVGAFLADLRRQPAHPGQTVMAPGDVEKAEAARRAEAGIPVDAVTWAALEAAAGRYGKAVPQSWT